MKFIIRKQEKEGFTDKYVLVFENGLNLYTPSLLWLDRDSKKLMEEGIKEVIEALQPGTQLP